MEQHQHSAGSEFRVHEGGKPVSEFTRRNFLALSAVALCAIGAERFAFGAEQGGTVKKNSAGVQQRTLGRTGEMVSIIGLGGSHIGEQKSDDESIRLIRGAIDGGITFMDNSWDYHEGTSEKRMGKALRDGYRQRVFLMTKIDGRDKETAAKQIDESLRRLQTDHVDLMQLHEIIRPDDPDKVFAKGGAFEAMIEAKKAGKFRYMGFTGHKSPQIHLKMLRMAEEHGWTPDTVQMPLNVMDAHYESFAQLVLPELLKRNIGVLGMKSMGSDYILHPKVVSAVECLQYALTLPTDVVITGIDKPEILQQALRMARDFKPLTKDEVTPLLNRTAQYAKRGEYEKYKSSAVFDSTSKHPEFLGKVA